MITATIRIFGFDEFIMRKDIISFDIFDTILTRTTASPFGVFALVDNELKNRYSQMHARFDHGFFRTRVDAERIARNLYCVNGREEITLELIYDVIRSMIPLAMEDACLIKTLELETEFVNSEAIPERIAEIEEHVARGDRVILISDMYLDSAEIRRLLLKHSPVFRDIPIYVSSEYGVTKGSGRLFRRVRREECVSWDSWTHYGDHEISDVSIPRSLGMNAVYCPTQELTVCEKHFLDARPNDAVLQLFIGAAKQCRLHHGRSVPVLLGSSYGAAILMQYVLWVLELCEHLEITQLYFVARDGWILGKIADLLSQKRDRKIKCKYIYGSRNAWRIQEYLPQWVPNKDIYQKTDAEVELLKQYLRQEIDLTDSKIGFVEVHGDGITQECLANVLASMTNAEIHSFYFILEKEIRGRGIFHRFTARKNDTGCVIETLTRAPHGRTIGYRRVKQQIKPILMEDEEKHLSVLGYDEYLNSAIETIELFVNACDINDLSMDKFRIGMDYYDFLTDKDNSELFSYLCDLPLTNTRDGKERLLAFAPKPTKEQIDAVESNGYLQYEGWCLSFSLRRLSCDERDQIDKNIEIYRQSVKSHKNKSIRYTIKDVAIFGKRIALYGAGRVGEDLFRYINENGLSEIVVWVDKKINRKCGKKDTIDHLENYCFDQIIVAVKNRDMAYDIMTDLMLLGYEENILFWEEYPVEHI